MGEIAWSRLQPATVEYCIRNIVYHKLVYPLVVTTLSQTQYAEIIKLLLVARLPVAGYVQAFPRVVIHGPFS